ncbi:hypothetical protein GEMRC1_006766 [Eukaryota sp. GEM-RC1]
MSNPIDEVDAFIAAEGIFIHESDPTLDDGTFCPYCRFQVEACQCISNPMPSSDEEDSFNTRKAPHTLTTRSSQHSFTKPSSKTISANDDSTDLSSLSSTVANPVKAAIKRHEDSRIKIKDIGSRSTTEQVLDSRTRMMLFKLLDKNKLSSINGVVSTGKEANVYHGTALVKVDQVAEDDQDSTETVKEMQDVAVKVFKTSILKFKDREKYVTGDWRFRKGYSKKNSRKMVTLWAEKEFRNLSRVHRSGIPSPRPLHIHDHIIIMTFIGKKGIAAPRLKDVADQFDEEKLYELYYSSVKIARDLWTKCKLVHGDYSEYNLLVDRSKSLVVIDVGQSVENDNPLALEFLRSDLNNVNNFFRKYGVRTISLRALFDLIKIDDDVRFETTYQSLLSEYSTISDLDLTASQREDAVFHKSFIPQTLDEVPNMLRDIDNLKRH